MSSGLREVTRPSSTQTSSSTQVPPALRTSVCSDGHEVSVRPRTTSASTSVHGAWQIAATGLPASKNERTNATASSSIRSWSGLPTPPGSWSASKSDASTSATAASAWNVSPLSKWFIPWMSPFSSAMRLTSAPASSSALRGSVSSTCSTPSLATRIATFLPWSSSAMWASFRIGVGPSSGLAYPHRRRRFMTTRNASQGILADEQTEKREEIVELLKKAYWMEIETVMSYIANSVNPDGVRAQEIIESLNEDIQEELGHAQQFAARIKELYGVVPGSQDFTAEQSYLQPPDRQTDIVHVIKGVIEAETGAIEHYNRVIEETESVDPVTNDMVIAILRDEEGHRRLFEGYLREYEAEGKA